MKHIQARIEDDFHKEVRLIGVRNNLTLEEMMLNGLRMYVHLLKGNEMMKEKAQKEVARVTRATNGSDES